MPMKKRLAALTISLMMLLPVLAHAEDTADVIRKLLAAGETSQQPQVAVSDVQTVVDFDLLSQLNPDTVGWIYQPDSGLNGPIMQDETDDWYHERGFDEVKIYQIGSVYLHSQDSLDDDLVILRGQARAEGCLGMIPDWREQENHDQRAPFRLLTPSGDYQAEVFACLKIEMKDLESWYPPKEKWRINYWLEDVLPASLIQPDALSLPDKNDRLMFIAAEHLNGTCTLLMTRLLPIVYTTDEQVDLVKLELDGMETQNGLVDAGPAGEMMFYAQNDPLFANMRYESEMVKVYRDFEGGGCGPTAMAIIVANLVEADDLPLIGQYARSEHGNLFCPCSVNRVYCDHTHVPYQLKTPQEYLRYLPAAIADFAAGNNIWDLNARRAGSTGTNGRFVDYICEVYGLASAPVEGLEAALELMKDKTGQGLILASALRGSPLSNSSHFVVITGVDDEYFYVLDPLRRTEEEYLKTDKRKILELVSPGVVRIRLEHYGRSDLSPVGYISRDE